MSDIPGPSKRALEQLSSQACVKLRRVEELYNIKNDDGYYVVTDVSSKYITSQSVVEEPSRPHEGIDTKEEVVTIKIEEVSCDPLNVKIEHEERPQKSSAIINLTPQSIEVVPEPPPYLIELKKTLGKKEILPPAFARTSKKVSIPGPWTEDDSSMLINKFTKKKSWLMPIPKNPAHYFDYFIDDDYLNEIVKATNQLVSQRKDRKQDSYILRSWVDLTVSEFKVFIGLLLHTGTSKHKLLGDYWRQHRLYKSSFPDYMTANRFAMILRFWSFPSFDREKRMNHSKFNHPIADHFNSVMETIYYPGRELSFSINNINFDAPSEQEFSLKVVSLHKVDEPIVKIIMDTRRSVAMDVEAVMSKLLAGKHKVGHAIYVGKAITPIVPAFVLFLLRYGVYCTGILDVDRFQVPDQINRAVLKPGECVSVFHEGLQIGKHAGTDGATLYVTSEFKKETDKPSNQLPEALRVYNAMTFEGSDSHHEIVNYFPWKTYNLGPVKKLFIYTLLIGISNANKLCNMFSGTKYNYHAYRLLVLEHLLPPTPEPPKQIKVSHKLVKIPKSAYRLIEGKKSVKFTARRDCKNFKSVKNTRTNTIYQCDGCNGNPALCMKCFFDLHSFDCL